jgi:hypothetical protein
MDEQADLLAGLPARAAIVEKLPVPRRGLLDDEVVRLVGRHNENALRRLVDADDGGLQPRLLDIDAKGLPDLLYFLAELLLVAEPEVSAVSNDATPRSRADRIR